MKKTIGIITMHAIDNFGSYLQTVALHNYLKKIGYSPTVIDYAYPNKLHLTTGKSHLNISTIHPKFTLSSFLEKVRVRINMIIFRTAQKRQALFRSFYDKYVNFTRHYATADDLIADIPNFDIYIAGSDQIWNPEFVGNDTSFLLSWVPNDRKKISYSSSFSISEIPFDYKKSYQKWLKRFEYISVREVSNICNELLGHDVPVTLDPTFLLSKNDWTKYFNKKPIVEGEYIFCYILKYKFNPYPYVRELINKIKEQTGYKVVIIDGPKNMIDKKWCNISNIGPAEFLNLIYNSKFVVTTSFHGTAFSVNFEKNFISLINDEATLDNRQKSLLQKMDMEECLLAKNTPLEDVVLPTIDYALKRERINELKKQSVDYLKEALR